MNTIKKKFIILSIIGLFIGTSVLPVIGNDIERNINNQSILKSDLNDGLVAYWDFNEGDGTVVYDSVGDNHGEITGVSWISGISGTALNFDGWDFVVVRDNPSLNFEDTDQFTLETWIILLYLGLITMGIGYISFYKGLAMMDASKGIMAFYFKPIIATFLSIIILHEIIHPSLYIGIVIELIAIFLVSNEKQNHNE